MTIAAFVVSIFALVASVAAALYARRTAEAADHQATETRRQADAAEEALRMAYTPALTVTLQDDPAEGPDVLYEIRNDGQLDLDSVIVHRPETTDRVRYPLAKLGVTDFEDEVELGPLRLGEAVRLLLRVGSTSSPPRFQVRITCRAGERAWNLSEVLEPRPAPPTVHVF